MEERFEKHREFLVDRIDPDFGLLDKLRANRILTREAVHKIKLKDNTTEDKNRILLDFILTNRKANELVSALKDSGQTHLVNYLNADGGYRSTFGDDWPLNESDISHLEINCEGLVDLLDTSDLCIRLFSEKVINDRQKQLILSKPTNAERNEALLDILAKFSLRQYNKTIACLKDSNQSHIVKLLSEGGVIVRVHVNLEGAVGNAGELEDEIIARFTKDLENYPLDEATRLLERTHERLSIVAAKKGQSIVLYIQCTTQDELLQLIDLLKTDRLKEIIEEVFTELVSLGDDLRVTLTWSLEEFRRAATYFDSDDVSLSGDLQSKLRVTERPSLSTALVEDRRHGGWLQESSNRPKPLGKICGCDASTQTDDESFMKKETAMNEDYFSLKRELEETRKENDKLMKLLKHQTLTVSGELPEKYKSDPILVKMIRIKDAKENNKSVNGLTILDKELFVVSEESSEVEVYDSMRFSFNRRWNLKELFDPYDIGSCNRNKCLYIINCKGIDQSNEILRVDPNGKLIKKWSTGDDFGDGLSVTHDSNVILTVFIKNKLNEYSSDGQLIREVNLSSDTDICYPLHAIKLTNGNFVVSQGLYDDDLHRVCIVDADGKLKKSFGEKCGSTIGHMNRPVYLSVDRNGFVMIADLNNSRVLLLDSNLKIKREILSEENHKLRDPERILLDESNGRLFVADNGWNEGQILIFQIK